MDQTNLTFIFNKINIQWNLGIPEFEMARFHCNTYMCWYIIIRSFRKLKSHSTFKILNTSCPPVCRNLAIQQYVYRKWTRPETSSASVYVSSVRHAALCRPTCPKACIRDITIIITILNHTFFCDRTTIVYYILICWTVENVDRSRESKMINIKVFSSCETEISGIQHD